MARRQSQRRLTPRSSGAPTAGHQARSGGMRYIFASPGLAPFRRRPLSSNVRPRNTNPSSLPAQECSYCRLRLSSHLGRSTPRLSLLVKCASRRRLRPQSQFNGSRQRRRSAPRDRSGASLDAQGTCQQRRETRAVCLKPSRSGSSCLRCSGPDCQQPLCAPALRVRSAYPFGVLPAASARNTRPRLSPEKTKRGPYTSYEGAPSRRSTAHSGRTLQTRPRHPCARRGLTPRSSGAPTAGHQRPAGGTRYIFTARAPASCRRRPLSSNVRHHITAARFPSCFIANSQ